jgi:hypothetical protein
MEPARQSHNIALPSRDNFGKFGDGVAAPENKGEDMVIRCLHGMMLV